MKTSIVNNLPIHRVTIIYKDGEKEQFSFSTERNAREFSQRQKNIPDVQSSKYSTVDIYA